MTVLVAGLERVDAGKTTFSLGLLSALDARGFKPRAGNDVWFHHDDYRTALADGRLYGGDAATLAAASPVDVEPEAINPVHRLWQPSPGSGTGLLGKEDREFLLDRVGPSFVVNGTVDIPDRACEELPLEDATVVESMETLNRVMRSRHVPAVTELGVAIADESPAVVESYGDVAQPIPGLEPTAAAVVEPGRATIYDGDRYAKACEVAGGSPETGTLETRVSRVVELLEPGATVSLPPLTGDERTTPETIESAYAKAYGEIDAEIPSG